MSDRVFTTGQIARIFRVAPRTVTKWFDAGHLDGYRIPFSNDRRVPLSAALRFARQHGLPVPAEIVGQAIFAGIPAGQPPPTPPPGAELTTSATMLTLGLSVNPAAAWHAILLDTSLGRGEVLRAGHDLRAVLPEARIVALAGEDECRPSDYADMGFDAVLVRPVALEEIAAAIVPLALTRVG